MVKVLCLLALTLAVAAAWPAGEKESKEDIFKALMKLKFAKKAVDKVREEVKSKIEPEELMRVKKEFFGNVKLRLLAKKLKAMMAEMGPMEAQQQMEQMMAEMGSQEDESDSGSEESAEMEGMDMEAMMQQIGEMMRQQMEGGEEPEPAGEEPEMESAGESEEDEMEGASIEEIAKKCFAEFKRKMAEASGNNPDDMGGDEPGSMEAEPDVVAKFAKMARMKVKTVSLFKTFIEFEIAFMTQGKILEKSKGKLDEKAIRGLFFEVFARFVESSMKIKEGAEKRFKFIDFVEAKLQKVQEKKRELEKKKRKFMEFAKAMLAKKD